jgi:hypothetical protein
MELCFFDEGSVDYTEHFEHYVLEPLAGGNLVFVGVDLTLSITSDYFVQNCFSFYYTTLMHTA